MTFCDTYYTCKHIGVLGSKLQKLYFRLLSFSILTLLCINIISFIAGFNFKQLVNPSFFDERVTALYYLAKDIVLEIGVHLEKISQDEVDILIEKASDFYDIDKYMLSILISPSHQYSLTVTGGMGLTTISCYDFLNSSFSNPYNSEENIMAAAESISKLQKEGLSPEDIIIRFIIGRNKSAVEVLANSEYKRAYMLANIYRINHASLQK